MVFKARWSTDQKQAVIDAAIRYGMTGEATWRAANDGSLPGLGQRLEPFPIALATCREYITTERKRRRLMEEAQADPTALMHEEAQALAVALRDLRRRIINPRRTPTSQEITELSKAAREVHALLKALTPTRPKTNPAHEPEDESPAPDFIDALAANGKKNHRPKTPPKTPQRPSRNATPNDPGNPTKD